MEPRRKGYIPAASRLTRKPEPAPTPTPRRDRVALAIALVGLLLSIWNWSAGESLLRAEKRNSLLEEILKSKDDAIALRYALERSHDYSVSRYQVELLVETDVTLRNMIQNNIESLDKNNLERVKELHALINDLASSAAEIVAGSGWFASGATIEGIRGTALMNRQHLNEMRAIIEDAHRWDEEFEKSKDEFRRALETKEKAHKSQKHR